MLTLTHHPWQTGNITVKIGIVCNWLKNYSPDADMMTEAMTDITTGTSALGSDSDGPGAGVDQDLSGFAVSGESGKVGSVPEHNKYGNHTRVELNLGHHYFVCVE